jgi:hypothetical protein
MAREVFIVGALYRGGFRRLLQRHPDKFTFVEDSGFLDSQFIVNAPDEKYLKALCDVLVSILEESPKPVVETRFLKIWKKIKELFSH